MQFGFTMDFRNPTGRPWLELWEDNLWLMCQAEALGFDYLLVQEHFFQRDGYGPSIPVFLTLLAERTKRARLGSYVYVLPLHNAAQLAQETAVLDQLSGGRVDVMVGAGHSVEEYKAFGYSPKTRPSRMEEGLTILKKAWTERPFDFQGRYYNLQGVGVYPPPLQRPHPPLWVAATSVAAATRAARHGANLAAATVDPAVYAAYADELTRHGRQPSDHRISKSWSFTTTFEDPEVVWRRNHALYVERWNFYKRIRGAMGDSPLKHTLEAESEEHRGSVPIGTPEAVAQMIKDFCTRIPLDLVIQGCTAGIPVRTELYASLKLFAEQVIPDVKRWDAQRRAATRTES